MDNNFSRLAGRQPALVDDSAHLISAVLLPIVSKKEGDCILFEVRSRNLNRQPGEICFPGGRVENGEGLEPLNTALRETTEELGISVSDIEILGPLDILVTPRSTLIYPHAGIILTTDLRPDPAEVEETFLVPLDFFLQAPPYISYIEVATRYQRDFPLERVPPAYTEGWHIKSSYPMYFYEYEKYFIWGLTCKILYNFLRICWPDHGVFKKPFKKWR